MSDVQIEIIDTIYDLLSEGTTPSIKAVQEKLQNNPFFAFLKGKPVPEEWIQQCLEEVENEPSEEEIIEAKRIHWQEQALTAGTPFDYSPRNAGYESEPKEDYWFPEGLEPEEHPM